MRGSAMISDACAPNTSSSAPSSRVCLSFGCSKQAAGNDARYEAREEHGKIDCWHGQPSFIPAGFSFLSVLPPRCLRLVAGLRGGAGREVRLESGILGGTGHTPHIMNLIASRFHILALVLNLLLRFARLAWRRGGSASTTAQSFHPVAAVHLAASQFPAHCRPAR